MVRGLLADGGDGPQIWKAAANILNKLKRSESKKRSSYFGIGGVLTNPRRKNPRFIRLL